MRDKIGFAVIAFAAGIVGGGLLVHYLKPNPHAWMLVGIMLAGGLVGGGVNYFLSETSEPGDTSVVKSLFIGVGAAFLVPLFLNMLSSKLLESSRDEPMDALVFLGFCLIAAISSKAFITTISDRLLKQVREAKEVAAEAREEAQEAKTETEQVKSDLAPIVSKETEAESGAEIDPQEFKAELLKVALSDDEGRVLDALASGAHAIRSLSGLARESGMNGERLRGALDSLARHGLAGIKVGRDELPKWYITREGRRVLQSRKAALPS